MHTIIKCTWLKAVLTAAKGDTPQKLTITASVRMPDYRTTISMLNAGMQYRMSAVSFTTGGVKAIAQVELKYSIKKPTEAELILITNDCGFLEEMLDKQVSCLLEESPYFTESSKTFLSAGDSEWTLELDDGQNELPFKDYDDVRPSEA